MHINVAFYQMNLDVAFYQIHIDVSLTRSRDGIVGSTSACQDSCPGSIPNRVVRIIFFPPVRNWGDPILSKWISDNFLHFLGIVLERKTTRLRNSIPPCISWPTICEGLTSHIPSPVSDVYILGSQPFFPIWSLFWLWQKSARFISAQTKMSVSYRKYIR